MASRLVIIRSGGAGLSHIVKGVPEHGATEVGTLCGGGMKVGKNTTLKTFGPVTCVQCITEWRRT